MSVKLSIGGKVSLFSLLVRDHTTSYNAGTETVTVGLPGLGPKSLDITSDEIVDFSDEIGAFDVEKGPQVGSLAEAFKRTAEVTEEDGVKIVRFRPSLAKASRAVTIPVADWPDFVRFIGAAAEATEATIEEYRAIAAQEAEKPATA